MAYRPRTRLWVVLDEQERSLGWLSRHVGCSRSHLSRLKLGSNKTLQDGLALCIAAVLERPVDDLFERVETRAPALAEAAGGN